MLSDSDSDNGRLLSEAVGRVRLGRCSIPHDELNNQELPLHYGWAPPSPRHLTGHRLDFACFEHVAQHHHMQMMNMNYRSHIRELDAALNLKQYNGVAKQQKERQ